MRKHGALELSIIIVNYNVRYFLEQCLYSVRRAVRDIRAEIRVVDNHSADGSMDVLPRLFPEVIFYHNTSNLGFARANNQALKDCKGDYVLFLNPDTLVAETTLTRALAFMHEHPAAGALGVRMLDGRGQFLPESKRAFPSPLVSLWKLTGMAKIFPKSGFFNRYALGNLDPLKNHPVPVLAGACMLARKSILDRLGGFDERYFLYGEDIDLSYRIRAAGFENWYIGEDTILHFKGESSDALGLTRVRFFYQAMRLFVNKYYRGTGGKLLSVLLQIAILAREGLAVIKRLIKPVFLPLADFLLLFASMEVLRLFWITQFRAGRDFGVYLIHFLILLLVLSFQGAASLTGLYDKRYNIRQMVPSLVIGFLVTLAVYSVLPEDLRFSRGVVLGGILLGGGILLAFRGLLWQMGYAGWKRDAVSGGQTLITGTIDEYNAVQEILMQALLQEQVLGRVATDKDGYPAVCEWEDLADFVKAIPVRCIIFCVGGKEVSSIITCMEKLKGDHIRFLFHVAGSSSLVGSHSLASDAEIVMPYVRYRLASPYQQRMKRVSDVIISCFFLLVFPYLLIRYRRPGPLFRNIYYVLLGKKTWVGYAGSGERLPPIAKGVMTQMSAFKGLRQDLPEATDAYYAKNYDWWQDIRIILRNPALACNSKG